jgi:glycosyltransferase involved in cell wall biosynthesis
MKILMVVTYLQVGGTETHVLSLARALKALGHTVGIASKGGPMVKQFRASGIPVHFIPVRANVKQMAQTIRNVIRANKYQILHAHDGESFSVVGMGTAIPSVISIHGRYHSRHALRTAMLRAKRVIAVSPSTQRWIESIKAQKVHVESIPNGIETALYAPLQKRQADVGNGFVAAYVGRFDGAKALVAHKVIRACHLVAKEHLNFRMILHGVGPSRDQLMRQARQVNRSLGRKAILFAPITQSVRKIYHSADLVVGAGRVAMEAMASGKPVIGFGTAGYEGLVTSTTLGKAVDGNFGDHAALFLSTPERLARDLKRIMKRPVYLRELGKLSRQVIVNRFSAKKVSRRVEKVYLEILNGGAH